MNLEALALDVIRPPPQKSNLAWQDWHAFRRGLATDLHRLGVSDKVVRQILHHANVTTTMSIHVKTVSADAANAMKPWKRCVQLLCNPRGSESCELCRTFYLLEVKCSAKTSTLFHNRRHFLEWASSVCFS
jgi:hypothetical protein